MHGNLIASFDTYQWSEFQKLVQILIKKCHIFITTGVVLAVTMIFQSNVLNQLYIPSDNKRIIVMQTSNLAYRIAVELMVAARAAP
jgi:hypothetical protein